MDLLVAAVALALAIALFIPLQPSTVMLLHVILVVLLAVLLGMVALRSRRKGPQAKENPLRKEPEPAPVAAVAPSSEALVEAGVVQFLARMQEKGRLVDFLMDDIAPYSNEQIGTAARVVHQGCREVLKGAFEIVPVHAGQERDPVNLAGDYDAATYRLVGKVPDRPPYQGTVLHRGWKAARISLPRVSETARESAARSIIAPAEVEIG